METFYTYTNQNSCAVFFLELCSFEKPQFPYPITETGFLSVAKQLGIYPHLLFFKFHITQLHGKTQTHQMDHSKLSFFPFIGPLFNFQFFLKDPHILPKSKKYTIFFLPRHFSNQ